MVDNRRSGKLAVILHADVAASTTLVQQDEHLAHERIQDAFRRFGDAITKYHGHVRELRGDALLAEFERASDAVPAALAFQADHSEYVAQLTDTIRPMVRVGIAMGEVVVADDTITGAGVVLAQRVEQLAESGGVCITAAIHESLPQRLPFDQESLGEQQVKGFDEPVRVYRVTLSQGGSVPPPQESSQLEASPKKWKLIVAVVVTALVVAGGAAYWFKPWAPQAEPAVSTRLDRPSIAVLPLRNLSGNSGEDYISAGFTEDVISAIGRYKSLTVMAYGAVSPYADKAVSPIEVSRALGVRYLVDGSMRKAGRRIRVSARLIDAVGGTLLWSEQFNDEKDDIFAVQDAITRRIAGSLISKLTRIEQKRVSKKPTENQDAYDLVLRGRAQLRLATRKGNREARRLFDQAIALDPDYAAAYAWQARAHYQMATDGWTEFPTDALKRAEELASQALVIDSELVEALRTISRVYATKFQLDRAFTEIERALTLNPSDAEAHGDRGLILLWIGRLEEAVESLETAFAFDPNLRGDHVFGWGLTYYLLRRHEDAIRVLERGAAKYPGYIFIPAVLVSAYGQLGRIDEAQRNADKLRRLTPFFGPEAFGLGLQDKKHYDYLVEGMRKGDPQ